MPNPVSLEQIKAELELAGMILVRNSRLSVQKASENEWALICRMGGL